MFQYLKYAALAVILTSPLLVNSSKAAECEPQALATKYPGLVGKTVKIAQDGESPPYSFRDPKNFENLVGLDADLARAAFACIGAPTEFFVGGWSGLLPAVIAGQADMIWDVIYYTPERAEKVDFVTYMVIATGAMVAKGNPKNIKSLDDVCGLRAAAGLGTGEEAIFRSATEKCTAAGKPAIEILTFPDTAAGVRLVQNDRADVMMTNLNSVDSLVAETPAAFERAFMLLTDRKLGVGINKSNPDLSKAVHDALLILQANGTEEAILKKYGVDTSLIVPSEILTK